MLQPLENESIQHSPKDRIESVLFAILFLLCTINFTKNMHQHVLYTHISSITTSWDFLKSCKFQSEAFGGSNFSISRKSLFEAPKDIFISSISSIPSLLSFTLASILATLLKSLLSKLPTLL